MNINNRSHIARYATIIALLLFASNASRAQDPCDTAETREAIEHCMQLQMKQADSALTAQLKLLEAKMTRMHMTRELSLMRKEQTAWQARANAFSDWAKKQYAGSDRALAVYLVFRRNQYQHRAIAIAAAIGLLALED
jgi:uncharacterized protein YecT (DUF1311 family)